MVIVARLDAKLVALNRTDGKIVWEAKIDEWKNGVTTNSAPLVVKDHVIVGVSGGEYGVRGYIKSFNVKTGALAWQTFTIPTPGEPGSETWPKDDTWKSGGGPTWLTGTTYGIEGGIVCTVALIVSIAALQFGKKFNAETAKDAEI